MIANATLVRVERAGFAADADRPATAGAVKWTGRQPVFWSERIDATAGHTSDVIVRRHILVDADVVDWAVGDVASVTNDAGTATGTVRHIATTRTPISGVTRIILGDA